MRNETTAAAAAVVIAMAIIGFIDQFVRVIAEQSSLWTFHLIRSTAMWGIALIAVAIMGRRLRVVSWRGVAGRSFAISAAMMIYFAGLGFLPVAQVAAGLFTAPIWVLILSVAMFGQRIGPLRIAAVLAGFAGVVLVLAPDPATLTPWTFLPAVAGAFYAVGALATRAWCPAEQTLVLALGVFACMGLWGVGGVLAFGWWGGEGGDFLTRGWVRPTPAVWGLIALQAVGSLVAVLLLTTGYQLAEASLVSTFEYSVLAFSAFFGWLLWDERLGPPGLLGLALIAAAGSVIAVRGGREAAA